ncbi:MAG: hypothetical protein ACE5FJ_03525 [Gemmatimonadales bacterium]
MKQLYRSIAVVMCAVWVACSDSVSEAEQYREEMKTNLLLLAQAEEQYFQQNGSYTTDWQSIVVPTSVQVLLSVQYVKATGWGAEAAHTNSLDHCAVWFGSTEMSFQLRWSPINEGEPKCKPLPVGGK